MLLVIAAVLGLAIGSFLNVVIYRVPAGLSVIAPPSACPNCHHEIRARDNVPLFSWLILRARCRDCGASISVRYPLVEVATSLAFVGVAAAMTDSILGASGLPKTIAAIAATAALLYLVAISIALSLIDIDTHRLPNRIIFPSYAVSATLIAASCLLSGELRALLTAGIGALALYVFYASLRLAYPAGMGYGDVKLAPILGAYLGWIGIDALVVGAFAAFVLGGIFAIALMAASRAGRKSQIPFGPWMILGAWVGIAAGKPIASTYLTLVGIA